MSQSGTDGRPARFDVRAAAAAAIVFGALGGGAETQQGGKPGGDGLSREALDDRPAPSVRIPPPAARTKAAPVSPPAKPDEKDAAAAPNAKAAGPDAKAPPPEAAPPKPAAPAIAGALPPEEAEALRADVETRLKALAPPAEGGEAKPDADPAAKLADKALAEILEDRRRRLDDHDKLTKELAGLVAPENDPERKLGEVKADLADLQGRLDQPVKTLTPPLFLQEGPIDQAGRVQMKEAIEAMAKDVKEYRDKLSSSPPEPEKEAKGPLAALRADRDRISQGVAAIKARAEGRADDPTPKSAADRKLASEREVNHRIEAAVENLRLQVVERKIARTAKQAEVAGVDRQRWIARVKLGDKILGPMRIRYQELAVADEVDLQKKAKSEQAKAERAIDPIERYKSERLAELLELQAAVVKDEQASVAPILPSFEEMSSQANRAQASFQKIKTLIEESELSRVDVLTINADYRRLEPERKRIRREEREVVDKRLRDFTTKLTTVELNQIEDRLLDQIDLDDLLDKLPPSRHEEATAAWRELEERHSKLLTKRREALKNLVGREQEILAEIDRRLAILDDESSFVRTHLFWVRDQDPISLTTVGLAGSEFRRVTRATIGLAGATVATDSWKRPGPDFLAASAFVVVLPLGIVRARKVLKRRLAQCLPPPAPAPTADAGLRIDMNPVVHQD